MQEDVGNVRQIPGIDPFACGQRSFRWLTPPADRLGDGSPGHRRDRPRREADNAEQAPHELAQPASNEVMNLSARSAPCKGTVTCRVTSDLGRTVAGVLIV